MNTILRYLLLVLVAFIAGAITATCMEPEPVVVEETHKKREEEKVLDIIAKKESGKKGEAVSSSHTVNKKPTKWKKKKITKKPDGSVVIDIEEKSTGGSTDKKEEAKVVIEEKIVEVIKYVDREVIKYEEKEVVRAAPSPRWHLQAMGGTQPSNDYKLQGGLSASYRVIGPWTVGMAVVAPLDSDVEEVKKGAAGFVTLGFTK